MDALNYRIGLGNDVHRLAENRRLILGGVDIPYERGLVGHSDADVLLHALIDALLGATGQGDIGEWFPNSDVRYAGCDSADLLREVLGAVAEAGWRIINLDCIVSAESPRLGPFKPLIRQRLSELLQLDRERINVKAKSGEQVGPIGRGEAVSAEVVVLLYREQLG